MTANNNEHFTGRIYVQEHARKSGKKYETKFNDYEIIGHYERSGELFKPTILASVSKQQFEAFILGQLDFIVWEKSPWSTSRLFGPISKEPKKYNIIRIVYQSAKEKRSIICKFEGFFITKSDHEVTMAGITKFVRSGSYVLKIGEVL